MTTKNEEVIKRHLVKNSPFAIIESEAGFFLALGKYRLSELMESKSKVEAFLFEEHWNITAMFCSIVVNETLEELLKEKEEKELIKN